VARIIIVSTTYEDGVMWARQPAITTRGSEGAVQF